jgi:hypothetical protein
MSSLKPTQSVPANNRSPQIPIPDRHDSCEAPHPVSINRPAAPKRQPSIPGIRNDSNPIFGHFTPPAQHPFPASTHQTPAGPPYIPPNSTPATHRIQKKYLRASASLRRKEPPPATLPTSPFKTALIPLSDTHSPQPKPNPRSKLRFLISTQTSATPRDLPISAPPR